MMVRVKSLLVAVMITAFGAASLEAQSRLDSGGARFLIGGGPTLGLGDFGDAFPNGPHGLAAFGFQPVGFPVGLRVEGMYHRLTGDDELLDFTDLDTRILSGTVNAVVNFTTSPVSPIRPYLIAGGGLYNTRSVGDDAPDGAGSETDFGINGGAGLDYRIGQNVGLFLEGRYHLIFTEEDEIVGSSNTSIVPISLGVRIGAS